MKREPSLHVTQNEDHFSVALRGVWVKESIQKLELALKTLTCKPKAFYTFDLSGIKDFDTHGIMLILHHVKQLEAMQCNVSTIGANESLSKLFNICEMHYPKEKAPESKEIFILSFLENVGRDVFEGYKTLSCFFAFTGELAHFSLAAFLKPHTIRLKAMFYHVEQSGAGAIPIILLTSFLIGIVIAYQGATQLEKFGANIFIVEMVTISAVRELAPLLAAIVIAGRSASAYTAQIGVMKITDEVDAMSSMGFSPWNFLVLPRLFALIISLPLLVFFADIVSVFGGMVIAATKLDVSFVEFIDRIKQTVALKHLVIGLIKAPIFGCIIATIGCFRGFQIDSSTESVGKYTTISVVNAIFWVIAMDAIISVLLTELGL
ncbi:ABC transporter permease [Sulfurospirillum oryzae]|uniref:ABC transporter permease n=1 Tax=Sulfurospirillum oryzae TaxID=2976535 RepID=UPI0021E92965|nr:ABC transporter permease [Sulfurospirillum oryzae]